MYVMFRNANFMHTAHVQFGYPYYSMGLAHAADAGQHYCLTPHGVPVSYMFSVIVSVLRSLSPFAQSSKTPSPLILSSLSVSRSEPESFILNTEPTMCTALQYRDTASISETE